MRERYTRIGNYVVRRPQAVPYHSSWTDHLRLTAEVVFDTAVLLILFLVLPVVLWLALS